MGKKPRQHHAMRGRAGAGRPGNTPLRREKEDALRRKRRASAFAAAREMDSGGPTTREPVEEDDAPETKIGSAAHAQQPSAKPFHKVMDRVVRMADIIVEVLDARDPLGFRCAALEAAVLAHGGGKKIVLLLNKADLVPEDNLQKWVHYLKRFHPTVPFRAAGGPRQVQSKGEGDDQQRGWGGRRFTPAHGVAELLGLLKNLSRPEAGGTSRASTVGVVGYPNVGKSSVINALKRDRTVTTGAEPGVTRHLQTVSLDRKIKLVDCPGVVMSTPRDVTGEADLVLRGALRIDSMTSPEAVISLLMARCSPALIRERYGIGDYASADDLLALVALKRGLMRKGGATDVSLAAHILVQDWNTGALPYRTEPPLGDTGTDAAELVDRLAPAFELSVLGAPTVEVLAAPRQRTLPGAGAGDGGGRSDAAIPGPVSMEDDGVQHGLLQALVAGPGAKATARTHGSGRDGARSLKRVRFICLLRLVHFPCGIHLSIPYPPYACAAGRRRGLPRTPDAAPAHQEKAKSRNPAPQARVPCRRSGRQ